MYPVKDIKENIMMHNTKLINILVVDIAMTYHIVQYTPAENSFVDFNSGKVVEEPVMWDYLPVFDVVLFDKLTAE